MPSAKQVNSASERTMPSCGPSHRKPNRPICGSGFFTRHGALPSRPGGGTGSAWPAALLNVLLPRAHRRQAPAQAKESTGPFPSKKSAAKLEGLYEALFGKPCRCGGGRRVEVCQHQGWSACLECRRESKANCTEFRRPSHATQVGRS